MSGAKCLLETPGHDDPLSFEGGILTGANTNYDTVAAKFGLRHGTCLTPVRRKLTEPVPAVPKSPSQRSFSSSETTIAKNKLAREERRPSAAD